MPIFSAPGQTLRTLLRAPGFAATMVLTLAVAIGATSAIVSVARSTFLRPLPFHDEQRLLRLLDVRHMEGGGVSEVSISARTFFALRERAQSFQSMVAQRFQRISVQSPSNPAPVVATAVSPQWLETLGVRPQLGRGFTVQEERIGAASHVAVVSHRFWQQRLGGDRQAIGRPVLLAGESWVVIGVMPAGFNFPYDSDVWRPWQFDRQEGRQHILNVQARLRPGVTPTQAAAELVALSRALEREYPDTQRAYTTIARMVRSTLIEDDGHLILLLLLSVGVLLLVAAANMTALSLARSVDSLRDMAVRTALGATALARVRPLIRENLVLTLLGGIAGLGLTVLAGPFLQRLVPSGLETVGAEVRPDIWIAATTAAVSVAIGLAIGFGTAAVLGRQDLRGALAGGPRSGRGLAVERTLRQVVVVEIALALVLLAGANEMISGLRQQIDQALGFDPNGLVTFEAALPEASYTNPEPRIAFVERAVARLRALPGVAGAGVVNVFPLSSGNRIVPFAIAGRETDPDRAPEVNHRVVSPGYFATLRIPLLAGRSFDTRDTGRGEPVVIVSQSMVDRYWASRNAIGARVRIQAPGQENAWRTIVGVAGDVVQPLINSPVIETWYVPYAQAREVSNAWSVLQVPFAVRLANPGSAGSREIEKAVAEVDPGVAVFGTQPASVAFREALAPRRLATILSSSFGAFGLLLALLGVYGVTAYSISRRRRELAVRRALGATHRRVFAIVLGQGLRLGIYGCLLGAVAAYAGTTALGAVFPGMGAPSIRQLTIAGTLLLLASALACALPYLRARGEEIATVLSSDS